MTTGEPDPARGSPTSESVEVVAAELRAQFDQVRIIAQGGSATVVDAVQRSTGRVVAVKLMRSLVVVADPGQNSEVKALASLGWHPNIATLLDAGISASGRLWLCMELAPTTLAMRLLHHPIGPVELLQIATELASALAVIHARSVIHCDLKPSNVLLAEDGGVRLADFGIARLLTLPSPTIDVPQGTAQYIAPEALEGAPSTSATDIWALGATLWAAAHGRPPFGGDGQPVAAIMGAARRATLQWDPPPSFVGPEADRLRTVIRDCMQVEPVSRPTAAEIAASLAQPLRVAMVARPDSTSRRRWVWAAAVVATSLIAALSAGSLHHNDPSFLNMPAKVWCEGNKTMGLAVIKALQRATTTLQDGLSPWAPSAMAVAVDHLVDDVADEASRWGGLLRKEPQFKKFGASLGDTKVKTINPITTIITAEVAMFIAEDHFIGLGTATLSELKRQNLPPNVLAAGDALSQIGTTNATICGASRPNWESERTRFGDALRATLHSPGYYSDLRTATGFGPQLLRALLRIRPDRFASMSTTHPDWFAAMLGDARLSAVLRDNGLGVVRDIVEHTPSVACQVKRDSTWEWALQRDLDAGEWQALRRNLETARRSGGC